MRARAVAAFTILALVLVAAPAAARFGMPEPLTERGQTVEAIYTQIAIAGILVFALVFALLVWVLVRYRENTGKGRATHEKHRGSLKAELVWTVIPLIIMLWIGVMAYGGLVKLDAGLGSEDYELEVAVTGYQWFWQMDYGEGVKVIVNPSANEATGVVTYSDTFHLPADTPILLNITGGDVIHAFNIMDANRAYVSMDDANPSGPHQFLRQVHSFPAGKYLIQCKEMCLNPGHGYMRAELIVEPMADFQEWKADRALLGNAGLRAFVDATVSPTGAITYADGAAPPALVVAGTRVGVKLTNNDDQAVSYNVAGSLPVVVEPGQVGRLAFDAAGGQAYNVTFSTGAFFEVEAVTPDAEIALELHDFFLDPSKLQLEAGKGYLIRATNVGGTGHNLFIGSFGGQALAASNNAGPGEEALVYYKPEAAGTVDMWCDVPGHAGLGMKGTVTIA